MESSSEKSSSGYNCMICSTFVPTYDEPDICYHCKAPICKKCKSCGFCLNCFLNLNDDSRKTLKLLQNMIWIMPIFTILVIFQGFTQFLIAEILTIGLFLGLYFFSRWFINKHSNRYFAPHWELKIKSTEYQEKLKKNQSSGFIDEKVRKDVQYIWKKPLKSSDQDDHTFLKEINSEIEEEHCDFLIKNDDNDSQIDVSKRLKQLNDKICPICGRGLEYPFFCLECNRKFCSQCGIDVSPFSDRCLCGYKFPQIFPEDMKKSEHENSESDSDLTDPR
jgi:hypothetical protein